MIPVVWKSYIDSPARGYYDQACLEWLLADVEHHEDFPEADGIILVTPGHWRDATKLNEDIARYSWVLLIITSDEEGDCPFWQVDHPNVSIWKHTPLQHLPFQPDRPLMLGWTPGTVEANRTRPHKDLEWSFAGQDGPPGNRRREQAVQVMRTMGGELIISEGFLQGLDRDAYFTLLRRSKVVPCPSGPNIPDTFRLYEALESGAVPIADATCPRGDWGYWHRVFPSPPVFPILSDWLRLPEVVREWGDQFRRVGVLAWWEQTKAEMRQRLEDDIRRLSGEDTNLPIEERITVVIPTSPIPSHPSTRIIEDTVSSVRQRLPRADMLILCDGVREELEHRREAYIEYLEELVWLCRSWNAIPVVFEEHQHQANMLRAVLPRIRTDLLLFVEHDTPLDGDIPLGRIGEIILSDAYHLVRFHHEPAIPREHDYLMRGIDTDHIRTEHQPRFMRTVQWSQRPHLARTDQYRKWIDKIPVTQRTMIEDAMHGPVASSDWEVYRVGIWYPPGSIRRSLHLDGREGDSKFEETFR